MIKHAALYKAEMELLNKKKAGRFGPKYGNSEQHLVVFVILLR